MKKYTGGCHCKNVQYEVELDLTQPVIECNCSHCGIKGILWQFTTPDHFTLTSGKDALTEYVFNTQKIKHQFCSTCGVEPFAYGQHEGIANVAINIRSIDGVDLGALTRTQVNGKDF